MEIALKRAYDPVEESDGYRVLVDRLWPRGISKSDAAYDHWNKDVAPSTELRQWYGHDPELFEEFQQRYRSELEEPERAEALTHLRKLTQSRVVTLLTASKAIEISVRLTAREPRQP